MSESFVEDWDEFGGVSGDWGHALVKVEDGAARVTLWNSEAGQELVLRLDRFDLEEFAGAVNAAVEDLSRARSRPEPTEQARPGLAPQPERDWGFER